MIFRMIRSCTAALLLTAAMLAQDSRAPKVRMVFPEGTPSEKVYVRYGLRQPGGGYSQHVAKLPAGALSFEVPVRTDRFKALVWVPGCKLEHFDVPVENVDIDLRFACAPLKTVILHGRVEHVDSIGPMRISVDYEGTIACLWAVEDRTVGYFVSCSPLDISGVATAEVAPDGSFEIALPDFNNDPIASHASHIFAFWLRGIKQVPPLLMPESSPRDSFQFAASYPDEVVFVPLGFEEASHEPH